LINAFDGSFEKDGTLKDPKWEERLLEQLNALKDFSLKLNQKPAKADVREI